MSATSLIGALRAIILHIMISIQNKIAGSERPGIFNVTRPGKVSK